MAPPEPHMNAPTPKTGPQTADGLEPNVARPNTDTGAGDSGTMPEEYIHHRNDVPGGDETGEPSVDPEHASAEAQAAAENEPPLAQPQASAPDAGTTNWQDQYLRLMADFENFKRRTNKEKEALARHAAEGILKSLLPVLDDLDRALKAAETSDNIEKLREGLTLVHRNFNGALHKQGIEPVQAEGQPFDSELHEAIATVPAPSPDRKGQVLEVFERGYTYQGKVLRYAKVVTAE